MLTNIVLCLSLRRPPIECAYLYSVIFRQLKPKKDHSRGWFSRFAFRFVFVHRGSYIITSKKYLEKEILFILPHLPKVLK